MSKFKVGDKVKYKNEFVGDSARIVMGTGRIESLDYVWYAFYDGGFYVTNLAALEFKLELVPTTKREKFLERLLGDYEETGGKKPVWFNMTMILEAYVSVHGQDGES